MIDYTKLISGKSLKCSIFSRYGLLTLNVLAQRINQKESKFKTIRERLSEKNIVNIKI